MNLSIIRPETMASIRWIWRSRAGWGWINGNDAPLGEERELYRLTITTGLGMIRIVELTKPEFHYTAAIILTDGGPGGAISVSLNQIGSFAPSVPIQHTIVYH